MARSISQRTLDYEKEDVRSHLSRAHEELRHGTDAWLDEVSILQEAGQELARRRKKESARIVEEKRRKKGGSTNTKRKSKDDTRQHCDV